MAWLLAALLPAAAARAQDAGTPPKTPERQEAAKVPGDAAKGPAPDASGKARLSREDAELVKDLALLERMDLLRNLELFEPEPQAKQTKEERP